MLLVCGVLRYSRCNEYGYGPWVEVRESEFNGVKLRFRHACIDLDLHIDFHPAMVR